jgi:hypothetical protein
VRPSLRLDGVAWVLLSAFLGLGAIAVTAACARMGEPPTATPLAYVLDWQPALGPSEPWRLWTCAWVHGSPAHLLVNVAGAAVVAFVGWRARLPLAATVAWLLAWPGTQLLMAAIGATRLAATMPHYFGLSGVLHAGVVVLGLWVAGAPGRAWTRERWIGAAIVVATLAKLGFETPWDLAPRASEALGIAVAPVAHACGAGAGLLAWAVVRLVVGRRG